ncbi:MAG: hypothetical protein KatS3mg015_1628 [Fimbriimonadales bacterium]|nr:MAG: hypothetical protein KatS3mg015_1628 [Fimbriimonadales bacterium]
MVALLCVTASAQVSTFYGVQWSQWTTTDRTMKLDYDWVRGRFVAQYQYGGSGAPLQYATIDLATRNLSHFATPNLLGAETLLTVLPTNWSSLSQGTTLFGSATTGTIRAIDSSGNVSTFATGLSAGGGYTSVRWDNLGVYGNDLFYADELAARIWRIDSSGSASLVTTLMDGQNSARPEPMIVLGSNPRYGQLQNSLFVGQNSNSSTAFIVDANNNTYQTFSFPGLYSLESFRVMPANPASVALYVNVFENNQSVIYKLENFGGIPNLSPDDLFVAEEHAGGGRVWHAYYDTGTNSWVMQQIAGFNTGGFLEDMVFAPVPEPGSFLALAAGLSAVMLRRRKR